MKYDIWLKYEDNTVNAMVIPDEKKDDMYVFVDMVHDNDENVRYMRLCSIDDVLLEQINRQIRNGDFPLEQNGER